jgi:copper chaperone NosL
MKTLKIASVITLSIILTSCNRGFEPFEFGKEACTYCKMMIVDQRYAAELIDKKGKIFKFDDIACLKHFIAEKETSGTDLELFVSLYLGNGTVIEAKKAVYLQDAYFKSPMKGKTAAFKNYAEAEKIKDSLHIVEVSWQSLNF